MTCFVYCPSQMVVITELNFAVQCSKVNDSAAQCSALKYSTVKLIAEHFRPVQYSEIECSTAACSTVQLF